MDSAVLNQSEALSAKDATHPRVSLDDMKAKIDCEHYFTAGEAITALGQPTNPNSPTNLLTLCILIMQNGFTIVGKSAPASPENFDAEKGRLFAYEDAIKQLWPLEGYALREKLSNL